MSHSPDLRELKHKEMVEHMKELSIEEKAKRYDESIEMAKRNYDTIIQMDNDCTFAKEGIVNTFHHIFPELAESEEEKLSKKLHECVCRAINNDKLPYEERKYISEQVIPYLENLEKQKEQKATWSEEDEVMLGNALWACKEKYCSTETYNWLKSLKDRMN